MRRWEGLIIWPQQLFFPSRQTRCCAVKWTSISHDHKSLRTYDYYSVIEPDKSTICYHLIHASAYSPGAPGETDKLQFNEEPLRYMDIDPSQKGLLRHRRTATEYRFYFFTISLSRLPGLLRWQSIRIQRTFVRLKFMDSIPASLRI